MFSAYEDYDDLAAKKARGMSTLKSYGDMTLLVGAVLAAALVALAFLHEPFAVAFPAVFLGILVVWFVKFGVTLLVESFRFEKPWCRHLQVQAVGCLSTAAVLMWMGWQIATAVP